jgi:hypothetical protein
LDASIVKLKPFNEYLGSTNLRYGWATSDIPYSGLNQAARYRERKNNKQILLFGRDVEAESASRLAAKPAWEGDILSNPDVLVCLSAVVEPETVNKMK